MFKKILIFLLFTINTYAFNSSFYNTLASRPVKIPENKCALIIASAKYQSEMKDYIDKHNIKDYAIYKTKNEKWYSLSLRNIDFKNRHNIILNLIQENKIPKTSYCVNGNKFINEVPLVFMPNKEVVSTKISEKNETQLNSYNSDKKDIDIDLDIENKLNINTKISKLINKLNKHIFLVNDKFSNLDKNITILNDTFIKFKPKVTKNKPNLKIITNHIEEIEKKLEKTNQQLMEIRFKLPDNFNYISDQSKIYSLIQENNLTKIHRSLTTINSKILEIYNKINNHNNLINIQKPLLKNDINLTNLNYQESFNEMNKKMDNLLEVENIFKSFSINENIDLFFAEINDKNKYNSKFIYELYLYGFIFFIFILLTFFILIFKNKYINQEIIYVKEPKSIIDIDENEISKLIASRVLSYTEKYDTKIVLFKNTVLLIGITIIYVILFYFWYSYIHKFDRLNMLEEYKYKIQLEQNINYQNTIIEKKINTTQSKINLKIKQLNLYLDKQKYLNQTIDKNFHTIQTESTKHINNFKTKVIEITDEMKEMKHQIINMRSVPKGTELKIMEHTTKKL